MLSFHVRVYFLPLLIIYLCISSVRAPPPGLRDDQRWIPDPDCPRGGVYKINNNSIRCHCWGHQGYICEPDGYGGGGGGGGNRGGRGCPPNAKVCIINNNSNSNANANSNSNGNANQNKNKGNRNDYGGDYSQYDY